MTSEMEVNNEPPNPLKIATNIQDWEIMLSPLFYTAMRRKSFDSIFGLKTGNVFSLRFDHPPAINKDIIYNDQTPQILYFIKKCADRLRLDEGIENGLMKLRFTLHEDEADVEFQPSLGQRSLTLETYKGETDLKRNKLIFEDTIILFNDNEKFFNSHCYLSQ